jgi:hypothetical protein
MPAVLRLPEHQAARWQWHHARDVARYQDNRGIVSNMLDFVEQIRLTQA